MNPSLATLICACGVAGLFYLDRDKTVHTSRAVWLPILWVAIVGSRAVSSWFTPAAIGPEAQLQGHPVDAVIFGLLEVAAFSVLVFRRRRVCRLLAANWPILAYFIYCLISVIWSYHTGVSLKRWIKSLGDIAMVLVIVTDPQPVNAVRRLVSRVGFVLLPASVLLIKYYPYLGRAYAPDGKLMNTGVTTNKNSLGVLLLVISLGTLWQVVTLLRAKPHLGRRRRLIAQITVLMFGAFLLRMANSQTSIGCFILGSVIFLLTGIRVIRRRPARAHVLCLSIVLAGIFVLLLGGGTDVVHAMGRKSSLTGRTAIWAALIPTVTDPVLGAGFESYWTSPNEAKFAQTLKTEGWLDPKYLNEAHNGYIEVYLELGWVGVALIILILATGYKRAVAAYRINPKIGGLLLAYVIAAMVYSVTEAGFRLLDPIWIFLLLAIIGSSAIVAGAFDGKLSVTRNFRNHVRKSYTRGLPRIVPKEPVCRAHLPQPHTGRAVTPSFWDMNAVPFMT